MTDLTPIIYTDTAHTCEKFLWPRSEPCHHGKRFRLSAASGQRLAPRKPTISIPPVAKGLELITPAQLRNIESQPDFSPRPKGYKQYPIRMDEECLRYSSQTKLDFIVGVVRGLGMVGFFLFLFVAIVGNILVFFVSYAEQGRDFKEFFFMSIKIFSIALPVCLLMWGGGNLIYRIFLNFSTGYQPGPMWELNRRTDMVIVFANSAKKSTAWKVAYELPFYEFDCYIQSSPMSQGIAQYNLSLVHYSDEAHVALVGMFGVTSRLDQLAAWDMVQRYMDTSQPLPDIPVFEMYRSLDPTTIQADKEIDRPPRYWRDMDDETFNHKIVELQDRLSEFYYG
ncbi:hypothetical protein HW452_15810 [Halomonas aquamarina]|uniref:Uncharacterized protein n=1 Tax=Vreelandella aquamarina TaxID=77097 RepID=A0ACC5VXN0_9GAMM|nr:hypothetical protein [Halomonas aquamarina]MBZ5488990.1 hypothetical protein [Halomonas aquamarina]